MSKHTPGPMHIHWPEDDGFPDLHDGDFPGDWEPCFLVEFGKSDEDYGGFLVSGLRGHTRERDGACHVYDDETIARLIAAAPDLLNALEVAEATIMRLNRNDSANSTLDVIRAAIAKAEGN